jgi:D-proline reductase (dithiol) PrdB
MVRLEQFAEDERSHLLKLPCPVFETTPFVAPIAPERARIALVSTAGLHRRSDRPFAVGEAGYRLIPAGVAHDDLIMSHVSTNFDRTGFQLDLNMVLPLDRLKEMEEDGHIGSLASYHYSFMGATDPLQMEDEARTLAALLKGDRVEAVLLVPV